MDTALTISLLKYVYDIFKQSSPTSTGSPQWFQVIRSSFPPAPAHSSPSCHSRQDNHCLGQNKRMQLSDKKGSLKGLFTSPPNEYVLYLLWDNI